MDEYETGDFRVTNIEFDFKQTHRGSDPYDESEMLHNLTRGDVEIWDSESEEWVYAGQITDSKHSSLRSDIEDELDSKL